METQTQKTLKAVDGKKGRKHRLPFHARDLYIRVSVRQPGKDNVHTIEFSAKDYSTTSHPTERDLFGTAKKLQKALQREFPGIQVGGIPVVTGDKYA